MVQRCNGKRQFKLRSWRLSLKFFHWLGKRLIYCIFQHPVSPITIPSDSRIHQISHSLGPILISRFILNLRRSQSQTSAADVSATLQGGATSTSSQQTVYRTLEFVSGGISSDLRDSPEMSSGSPNDYSTQEAYATGSCLSHDSCLGISSQEHGAEVQ